MRDGNDLYVAAMGDKDEISTPKFKTLMITSPGVYCVTTDKAEAAAFKTRVPVYGTLTVKALVQDPVWHNRQNILAKCNFDEAGNDGDTSARWDTPAK
jgi:hypothetical protein